MPVTCFQSRVSPRLLHYSDLENAYDTPERIARVATAVCERAGSDTLVAGSGDNTGPGVLSLVTEGRQSMDFFEAIGADVDTVGNHDLDHGPDATLDLVTETPQQWVLANVSQDGDLGAGPRFGSGPGIEPWTVREVADSRIGVTGVVDDATPDMTPGVGMLTFHDPVAGASEAVDSLTDRSVDWIVVLAHTTTSAAREIARLPAVDAVLAGHRHDPLQEVVAGTPVTRPGATGRYVYEVDLDVDPGATAPQAGITRHGTSGASPHSGVERALQARIDAAGLDEVIDTVREPISRERSARLAGEWRLGNFIADAYRWASGADVGLQNAGGIREGPPLSGAVTVADLISVSPFDEPVVVAAVDGETLRSIAAEADGRRVDGLPDYWWGHVSGMHIRTGGSESASLPPSAPASPSAEELSVYVDGEPPVPDQIYRVATPRYLLETDREFPTLEKSHRVDSLDTQYEVIVDYARAVGINPELDGRVPRQ